LRTVLDEDVWRRLVLEGPTRRIAGEEADEERTACRAHGGRARSLVFAPPFGLSLSKPE
jgi:hypothetical protein